MQRENRFRRTSASGDRTTQGPSVQFRPAAREVFLQRPDDDANTILSQSFQKFFGDLTQTAQTLQAAEHRVNMQNIDRENKQQKAQGVADATGAALVVKQLRGMSTDLKDNLNTALLDSNDPSRQANAFVFWNSLERNQNVDVTPYMSVDVDRSYRALQRILGRTDGNVQAAVGLFNGDPSVKKLPADISKADWSKLMEMPGKPQGEALGKAHQMIKGGLAEAFGITGLLAGAKADKVILAGDAESDIMGIFAAAVSTRKLKQLADLEGISKRTFSRALGALPENIPWKTEGRSLVRA